MPGYKVYQAEIFSAYESPLIITTAYEGTGTYKKAEWFLIRPDKECQLLWKRIGFSGGFEEEFVFSEAQQQAILKLRTSLFEDCVARNRYDQYKPPVITELQGALIHYWVRDVCADKLVAIYKLTECKEFKEALGVILELPKITIYKDIM